jgi:hypothetical protein
MKRWISCSRSALNAVRSGGASDFLLNSGRFGIPMIFFGE